MEALGLGLKGWDEPGCGCLLQQPSDHAPPFQRAPTRKLAVHYIRNANTGDSGSWVPGVHFPISQSEAFGAATKLWASDPGRPGRRAAWWRRRAGERAGRSLSGSRAHWHRGCVASPGLIQAEEEPGAGCLCLGHWGAGAGARQSCSGCS